MRTEVIGLVRTMLPSGESMKNKLSKAPGPSSKHAIWFCCLFWSRSFSFFVLILTPMMDYLVLVEFRKFTRLVGVSATFHYS